MEFPNLGKQCTEPNCNQLDYLPVKCDACGRIFCGEHMSYARHNCPSAYKKDVQVPVCPLCNIPILVKRGEQPDIVVGAHIDSDCQSDPAKNRRKVFINRCSVKNCKVKEVVPVICDGCKLNFCLKHRHPTDHQCEGSAGAARRRAAEAALSRHSLSNGTASSSRNNSSRGGARNTTQTNVASVQGGLSEDEALARALALSLQETSGKNSHPEESEDLMLARAIAESERQHAAQHNTNTSRCNIA